MYALTHINSQGVRFYENIDTKEHVFCKGQTWWKVLTHTLPTHAIQIPTPESCRFLSN